VNFLLTRLGVPAAVLSLGLNGVATFGAWRDQSVGQPLVENITAKDFVSDGIKWTVTQDKLGRLFVGGDQLQVFDGQAWQSFPVPNTYGLRALAFGEDGRLWAGAINEIGYFEEQPLGIFKYRSLIQYLPKGEHLIGDVWGCVPVGPSIYFICHDKLLRWDGTAFQVWPYAGKTRLFPLSLNGESWFHHRDTGLYRLTEAGPRLEIPAADLPAAGILGLAKDQDGLVLVSSVGFYRPGNPPHKIFNAELNQYIIDSHLACFSSLRDGNYAVGTVNGGIALVGKNGELLRILDTNDGLPVRSVFSIIPDSTGYAWCATPNGIFRFEANGQMTLYGPANGLKGQGVVDLKTGNSLFYALTPEGVFALAPSGQKGARFEKLPQLTELYTRLLPYRNGLLLARHGGLDFFDGTNVRPLFTIAASGVFFAQPSHTNPETLYLSENFGLAQLTVQPDGSFVHTRFLELPDTCISLHEDSAGRLWIGTNSKGSFIFDPGSRQLSPLNDPATGEPMPGWVSILGNDERILLFHNGPLLQARPDGTGLRAVEGAPAFEFITAHLIPGSRRYLIAFKHPIANGNLGQGVGILEIDGAEKSNWQELDLPALSTIGPIRTLEFSVENNRLILWVGGAEGLLRLDYETIPPVQKPNTPFIRLDTGHSSRTREAGELSFPFKDHRISFKVFTGDFARGKDWMFQSRLGTGTGEWSVASSRRAFEFTNLSEGNFRFEIRAVNSAGLTSEPASFTFSILPPWYRSGWAYAGYAASLAVGVFGFIRIRERRIRARNRELETLVEIRTQELVKANAAKDEFLASVSHEIRNPMNGVIGIAETFKTEALDQESRHKFGLLRQCASHLSSLLEDILDFSRVQAGAVELEAKPFDLPELVGSIAAITAAESEKRGIPVEIAISPAVPQHLTGDPRRIRQILLNFVSNALKYSGRGQVSVTVWCKAAGTQQTEVIFAVSDEGPGISQEEQKKLFTRFERGAAAQQGRVPGTGLGLALCRALAEKMGGRIWLESEPGEGSCFYFSAPFAIAEALPQPTPASVPPVGNFRSALVVDDEEYNRLALTGLLESLGFSVQSAADGPQALMLARSHDFDIMFIDYALPGVSGLDVTRTVRQLPGRSAQAVILATTAFTTPEKRNQCLAAGMNAFLGKPVTMERLRQALAAANPGETPVTQLPADDSAPTDRLANLRLLATKKCVPLAEELALYFSELEVELEQLNLALQEEEAGNAGHYAHLLYGRCGFIHERELEQTLRKIEAAAATGRWADARLLSREVQTQLAGLRIRLALSAPIAPPV
jgi:signal transduction histidine kinase/CheY-like chemotaxis protein/HPt (histidine-containing phosphotransfer) domain-containing protein